MSMWFYLRIDKLDLSMNMKVIDHCK